MTNQADPSRAFLDQVLAHPEDDVPRLIYADFLEERGDPRGEFIRLQCQLDQMDEYDPHRLDLKHRCDELLFHHGDAWASELKQDVRKAEFARGFIDKITIRARAFIKEGDKLYRSTPVNWLRFNYIKGAGEALAATAALAQVRSLDLSDLKIPDNDLIALLTSRHLHRLGALNLTHFETSFGESVGTALGEMPSAESLQHLEIPSDPEFLRAVCDSDGFPSVEHLAVVSSSGGGNFRNLGRLKVPKLQSLKIRGPQTVAATESIAKLPVDRLQRLDMDSTHVPAKGLAILAKRGAFDQVTNLSLAGCDLGVRAAEAIFQGQHLQHCRSLNLAYNSYPFVQQLIQHQPASGLRRLQPGQLNSDHLRMIGQSEVLQQLEFLRIEGSDFPLDLAQLAATPLGKSLRCLHLFECRLSTDSRRQLADKMEFPNVVKLIFGGDVDNIHDILTSQAFPNLRSLELDSMYLPGRVLATIAKNSNFSELREISYRYNRVSRKEIDAVMNSPRLPKLTKLVVSGSSGSLNRQKLIADYGWKVQS